MLQQTTVESVARYYDDWLRRFPNVFAVANATEAAVLCAWQGLGYYARARNLHRCAKEIVEHFGGSPPRSASTLQCLPGLGRYTANAVAVFAYGQSLPLVEANTTRVLARLFNIRDPIHSTIAQRKLWMASSELTPSGGARSFHWAMMDLGALICTPRAPACSACPVRQFCTVRDPDNVPVKRRAAPKVRLTEAHSFIIRDRAILLARCQTRWGGMWMLPETREQLRWPAYESTFPFTRHQINLRVFRDRSRRVKADERWVSLAALDTVPIPSPHRRAIERLHRTENVSMRTASARADGNSGKEGLNDRWKLTHPPDL